MIPHWSYSSLSMVARCPRSWFAKYVAKIDAPTSAAAGFGSQFDQFVAAKLGLGKAPKEPVEGVEDAVKGYLALPWAWTEATAAQREIKIDTSAWEVYQEMYRSEAPPLRRPYVGYIDLVREDNVKRELVDLKTSKMRGFKPDWALQTLPYAMDTRSQVVEVHLMVRTKTPRFQRFVVRPNDSGFRWALNTLGYLAEQGEKLMQEKAIDGVAALPGFWCSWCGYGLNCEAHRFSDIMEVPE